MAIKEENKEIKYLPFDVVGRFMTEVMEKAGIPDEDALIISDVLVQADKFGFDSHGVNRLKPIYLDRIKEGIMDPVTRP